MTDVDILAAHREEFGVSPDGAAAAPISRATAPATWVFIGDSVDAVGGTVAIGLAQQDVQVAVSPAPAGGPAAVTVHWLGRGTTTAFLDDSAALAGDSTVGAAGGHQLAADSAVKPGENPSPAAECAGLAWSLISKQLISRAAGGWNITVHTAAPLGRGLGVHDALLAAVALALYPHAVHDAPALAKIAASCADISHTRNPAGLIRARFWAALRGGSSAISVVDFADGSLTGAPLPGVDAWLVYAADSTDALLDRDTLAARERFVRDAERTFGVRRLLGLPDVKVRVDQWLAAAEESQHAPATLPPRDVAAGWLELFVAENDCANQAVAQLRSRKALDAVGTVDRSTALLPLSPQEQAVVDLCHRTGAVAARPAHTGATGAVIAMVPSARSQDFAEKLRSLGLDVLDLGRGQQARIG